MKYLDILYKDFFSIKGWSRTEFLWLSVAVALVCLGSAQASLIEFLAALTNVVCVILVAKGRVSNFVWGLAGVILYAIVSYKAQLYGNFALNLLYVPMQYLGVYYWVKEMERKETIDVPVKRLNALGWYQLASVLITTWVMTWVYLDSYTDDPSPFLDAFCLVGSLIAMWLMVKQYSEQWLLWIAINIVSIYLWVIPALGQPGSWAQVAQWSVLLINALYGAYKWFIIKENK